MSSRAEALGRHVACGLALPLAALAADPDGQLQPTHVSVSPDRSAGLQAFAEIEDKGIAPLNRATCHSTQNSPLAQAPPGLDTGGPPGWRMPPTKMKMSRLGPSD